MAEVKWSGVSPLGSTGNKTQFSVCWNYLLTQLPRTQTGRIERGEYLDAFGLPTTTMVDTSPPLRYVVSTKKGEVLGHCNSPDEAAAIAEEHLAKNPTKPKPKPEKVRRTSNYFYSGGKMGSHKNTCTSHDGYTIQRLDNASNLPPKFAVSSPEGKLIDYVGSMEEGEALAKRHTYEQTNWYKLKNLPGKIVKALS